MLDLATLNENQRQAVEWNNGPLLVLAGPGSGKTRVLTSRVTHILEQSSGQHFRILALTFTNKAAAEMRGRVEALVPNELRRVRLTTFHSFAAELLQQHGHHINFRPDFQILSNDSDREALLDDVLAMKRKELNGSFPDHFNASQLLKSITYLLENCVTVDKVSDFLRETKIRNAEPLAGVYIAYRNALRKTNSLDFPSLIAECLDLLNRFPFIVKHIRKVYKHILVDEFQDTNVSQYDFLSLIAKPDPATLFVVADDDQIIYQWNGASPERILSLRNDFHVAQLQLPENYRCPSRVIQLANALIEKNLNRSAGKKPLVSKKQGHDDVVRVLDFQDLDQEAAWIAQDILNRGAAQRYCAVLARSKKLLDHIGQKLEQVGIQVYFAARKDEFKCSPLRMLHAILRLANSKEDKQSLARLAKAFYEIEGINTESADILSRAAADGQDLLRAWLVETLEHRNDMSEGTLRLLEKDIEPLLFSLNYRAFSGQFFKWADGLFAEPHQMEHALNEYEEERQVWDQMQNEIIKKFEGEDVSLYQFLQELDLTSKTPPKPPDAIPCFTIHASKGMEFGHVYLMGMVEDQLPSWAAVKKGDESLEMQEERRNCFVAITRVQNSLTMTFSRFVFGWSKRPSRFLHEMGIDW